MSLTQTYDFSVGAIIRSVDDAVLLIQRAAKSGWQPNAWELPGGKPDPGERASEALKREVREETTLEVEVVDFAGAVAFEHPMLFIVMNYFHCHNLEPEAPICLSDEHQAWRWVKWTELDSISLTPPAEAILQQLLPE